MNESAFLAQRSYILETTPDDPALTEAARHAEEFGLSAPDPITGSLLSTLAASAVTAQSASAIAVTPAAAMIGLYLLKGLGAKGHLTCIDPETEHQRNAKACFQQAGYRPGSYRFLPSRPLEVMGRLAGSSYQLVYGDVRPTDLGAFITAAWPLLVPGGILVLSDSLLDGTLADETRKDRDTAAAREADSALLEREDALVTRLPLGAGLTIATKLS